MASETVLASRTMRQHISVNFSNTICSSLSLAAFSNSFHYFKFYILSLFQKDTVPKMLLLSHHTLHLSLINVKEKSEDVTENIGKYYFES